MLKHYKFSDVEIAKLLNKAIILVDTREKDTFQNDYLMSIARHVKFKWSK